jgi:cytochrome c-type biogenesis protein CcmH
MSLPLLLGMALLVAVALALLLWPLLRGAKDADDAADVSRPALNAAVYRDQLGELERDRAAGTLSEPAFVQSSQELQRRALDDTAADAVVAPPTGWQTPKRLVAGMAIIVPLAATILYAWLGNPDATQEPANPPPVTAAQIDDMVARLAARLQQNPDDPKGWAMLGRSYKALGRFQLAEQAFGHAGAMLDQDANLLADYAEVMARQAEGNFEGKPQAALNKALQLDPDNPQVLALAGIAAYQRQAYNEAADRWEHMLTALPPGSEQAKSVEATIAKARAMAQPNADSPKTAKGSVTAKAAPAKSANAASNSAVSGRVTLAPALTAQVKPGDTLFVFARVVDGPRMPLAILRTTAAALPLEFTLDDARAMSPQFKLSTLAAGAQVRVEARISKSGEALPKTGDFTGSATPVKPGTKGLKIVIESTVP